MEARGTAVKSPIHCVCIIGKRAAETTSVPSSAATCEARLEISLTDSSNRYLSPSSFLCAGEQ